MIRRLPVVAALAAALLLAGCNLLMPPQEAAGQTGTLTPGAQTTIIGLQTWLMIEQNKAKAAGNTARANSAGSIMTSLGSLRTEPNCARRVQLATAVSTGLQAEFPAYQSELGLGTNLGTILVSGVPGCQ
ncbi:MAG: hypothetical protein ACOY33_11950 [Pseudomonadota bacterium]